MELYDNCCVWVSHWKMIRYPGSVKARRVRRDFPKVYAGTVFTFCQLGDELTSFKGWTWRALSSGASARYYGRPIARFSTKEEMVEFVQWFKDWLNWALRYGQPRNGGSPIQIEWNGDSSSVSEDCKPHSIDDSLPRGYGNLVWARVRCPYEGRTQVSMVLLDLEQITRQDGYDPYVRVMHEYPRCNSRGGVYACDIVSVSDRAMRVISGR